MSRARPLKRSKTVRPTKRDLKAIEGVEELHRRIGKLNDDVSKKEATKVVRAVGTNIARAMRSEVTKSNASPDLKRAARRTIKQRIKRVFGGRRSGSKQAKVGFGVGKQTPKSREGGRPGVGIDSSTIQWFVLGTEERELSRGSNTGPKAGHPTGRVENVFAGLAMRALSGGRQAAMQAAVKIYQRSFQRAGKRK